MSVCAVSLALLAPAPARADVFSPISLVSSGAVGGGSFVQQADYAHDSAISADGRYVAFDGSIGGVTGVWRRDLETNTIEQVAGGDAAMPSISENGQYVSFTTNEGASLPEITHALPDSEPHHEAVQVYRRDMNVEPATTAAEEAVRPTDERAFLAASVPSGSEEPLRYANPRESEGSYAVGRTAMSANGEKVAFVTDGVSNLVAYPELEEKERAGGETLAPHTPTGQVAVHDFQTGTTELVSRCDFECGQSAAAEPVVAGEAESKPVGAVTLGAASFPKHGRAGSWPGASISADGTTVAWMGQDVAQQAPTLAHEGLEALYQEPLWRRLPAAANETRRVTGGSDPEAPRCAASGEVELMRGSENASDPCQGPFVREVASSAKGNGLIKGPTDDVTPRLSENGEEVVFGANAKLIAQGADFGRGEDTGNPTDLFLVSMQPGLTRTQALTTITETGASGASDEEITDYEISPDGEQVAFSTVRTIFTLGQPTLVSPALGEVGMNELYDADLASGTLTRVTHGYEGEGEPSEQPYPASGSQSGDPYRSIPGVEPNELGALTPDFSGDGDELVFTSTAANLVYGDGNSPAVPVACCQAGDGSDVFAVTRRQFADEATPQQISPAPEPSLVPAWSLGVTALSRPNGSVLLYVQAPGAGAVRAGARGSVLVRLAGAARAAHRASSSRARSGAAKNSSTRKMKAGAARRVPQTVTTRTLATRSTTVKAAGMTTLTLALAPRYAALARKRGGLSATVTVTFTAPGHTTLRESIAVTFLRTIGRSGKKKKAGTRNARGRSLKSGGRR